MLFTSMLLFGNLPVLSQAIGLPINEDAKQVQSGTYYLQNVATGKFFDQGGKWDTHAMVSSYGLNLDLKIEENTQGRAIFTNGQYSIGYTQDGDHGPWVDADSIVSWNLTKISDGIYKIGNALGNWTVAENDTVLLTTETGETAQWRLVTFNERLKSLDSATKDNPVDATFLLKAAKFRRVDPRNSLWGDNLKIMYTSSLTSTIVELFSTVSRNDVNYDNHQTIIAKNGTYKLTMQGCYRHGWINDAALEYINGVTNPQIAEFYANDKSTYIMSIMEGLNKVPDIGIEPSCCDGTVPDNPEQAAIYFSSGQYVNTIDDLTVTNNTLTIGIRHPNYMEAGSILYYDNICLYYYGNDNNIDDIESAGKYYLKNVATNKYLSNGARWGTHTIVDTSGLEFELFKKGENKFIIKNNGLFVSPSGKTDEKADIWVDLQTPQDWIFEQVADNVYIISDAEQGNLTLVGDTIVYLTDTTDEKAQWKLVSFEDRLKELNQATPEHPVDASFLIRGNNYFADLENSQWVDLPNWMILTQKEGRYIEVSVPDDNYRDPFNFYQTCSVKNGVYKLTAQGYYRAKWNYYYCYNGEPYSYDAILYANEEETPLMSIFSEDHKLEQYEIEYYGQLHALPAAGAEVMDFFKHGLYVNTVENINVTDGKLVVGVKNNTIMTRGSWMTCYNFRLYYYGDPNAKSDQTLSQTTLPTMTYGDATYTLPTTTIEGLNLTWSIDNSSVATITDHVLTIVGAGTATVTATQAGNDNYQPFSREFTLTVSKAALTITADDKEKQQGEDNPALTVSYAGFKYNDNASSLTKQPTVTTTATVNSPAGTYPITASGAEADNYTISYVQGTLTVTAAPVNTTVLAPSDVTGREDEEVELPITLDNAEFGENVVGVSFTLQLPEGVSVVLDEDDDPVWSFVSERVNKKQFNVTPAQYADGTWGFRVYTTSASGIIKGTSGAFMTLTLKVAAGVEDGEYTIKLKDNKLSVKDATNNVSSVTLADATSTLTIENYVLGDVNADGEIDLSDAIMVTYYSLHIVPSGFILKAADMNADGEVDLSDAIIIIYKSLGVIDSRSMQPANEIWYANDYLQMDADANGFSVSLTNEGQYLGMQYDLVLPEGMTLEDVTLNKSRAAGHTVMWNRLEDGSYRVVAFSTNGTPFFGNMGELLNLRLSGNHAGQVRMENIFFVGIDLQKHLFEDLYLQTTGICEREKGIVKSGEAVYDLQGRKVTTPRKGLYLKGNNKYLVK